ncbi:MAG: hypothetical protein ACRC30_11530 [Clostridium sp.]
MRGEIKSPRYKYKKISIYIYFVIALFGYLTRTTYVKVNEIAGIFEEKIMILNLVIIIAIAFFIIEIFNIKKYKEEGVEDRGE